MNAPLPAPGASQSLFVDVRGLRLHLRCWGPATAPKVFLLHGFLDCSATWSDVGAGLAQRFRVLALDQRGFGESAWTGENYWFPDYVADLDEVVRQISPEESLRLVGHSMGAQVVSLYAGLRPERVSRLVVLDGLFLPDMNASLAPKRLRGWLEELADPPRQKYYDSFEQLAQRVKRKHPQLSDERALYVARGWGRVEADGRIALAADPAHRMRGPMLYRLAESMAIWREVTAETLFVQAGRTQFASLAGEDEMARRRSAFRNHRVAVIPNAGHMLNFDAPEETARAIVDFLAQ